MKTYAIIPSGGLGKRMNNPLPKQYIKFNNKELIAYTLSVFQQCNLIDEIIVSAQKDYFSLIQDIKEKNSFTKLTSIVEGGSERQFSVFNALKSIIAQDNDLVVVHDAVRPLLSQYTLIRAIETAKESGSAIVAIKAKDTLIKGDHQVLSYIDRDEVFYVQTPQIFKYKILYKSMESAESKHFVGTDESMLVHLCTNSVKIVEGSSLNFKITSQDDIKLFKMICDNITTENLPCK
jgi:2-C-methyl-D-erythritol 4-phosphate cytidylyltransferase